VKGRALFTTAYKTNRVIHWPPGFVKGHSFSRAAKRPKKNLDFSPVIALTSIHGGYGFASRLHRTPHWYARHQSWRCESWCSNRRTVASMLRL